MVLALRSLSSRHHPVARAAQPHRARMSARSGKAPYGASTTGQTNYTAHNTPKTSANTSHFSGCGYDGAQGEVLDLWYFRARYFDAELGRFIARDPLRYIDGMSMYRGYFVPRGMDPYGLTVSTPFDVDVEDCTITRTLNARVYFSGSMTVEQQASWITEYQMLNEWIWSSPGYIVQGYQSRWNRWRHGCCPCGRWGIRLKINLEWMPDGSTAPPQNPNADGEYDDLVINVGDGTAGRGSYGDGVLTGDMALNEILNTPQTLGSDGRFHYVGSAHETGHALGYGHPGRDSGGSRGGENQYTHSGLDGSGNQRHGRYEVMGYGYRLLPLHFAKYASHLRSVYPQCTWKVEGSGVDPFNWQRIKMELMQPSGN